MIAFDEIDGERAMGIWRSCGDEKKRVDEREEEPGGEDPHSRLQWSWPGTSGLDRAKGVWSQDVLKNSNDTDAYRGTIIDYNKASCCMSKDTDNKIYGSALMRET